MTETTSELFGGKLVSGKFEEQSWLTHMAHFDQINNVLSQSLESLWELAN